MSYRQALAKLDNGEHLSIKCPDGVVRRVWGYNAATGDLFVLGWARNVWMDCSDGTLRAEFE